MRCNKVCMELYCKEMTSFCKKCPVSCPSCVKAFLLSRSESSFPTTGKSPIDNSDMSPQRIGVNRWFSNINSNYNLFLHVFFFFSDMTCTSSNVSCITNIRAPVFCCEICSMCLQNTRILFNLNCFLVEKIWTC